MEIYNSRSVSDIPNELLLARDIFLNESTRFEQTSLKKVTDYYHIFLYKHANSSESSTFLAGERNIPAIDYIYNTIGVTRHSLSELSIFLLDNINLVDINTTFVVLCTDDLNGIMAIFEDSTTVCRNCGIKCTEYSRYICTKCNLARFCSLNCQQEYWKIHKVNCINI